MSTHPCVTQVIQDDPYHLLNAQYCYPVEQLQQQQQITTVNNINRTLPVIQSQTIPIQSLPVTTLASVANVVAINDLSQVSSVRNTPTGEPIFIIDNNCYMQQTDANVSDLCDGTGLRTNNMGQLHVVPTLVQKTQPPLGDQINVSVQGSGGMNTLKDYVGGINTERNDFEPGFQKFQPPENHVKSPVKIPEPTQVKVSTDERERIGQLKIQVSGSFMSWNVAGRTILDLTFMRNLFNITNLDLIFQSETPYETGLCEGLNKLVQNKLFSDWLVLKCEGKQIPFFKVNNQVEMFSVNNFSTLLSVIAQESCLPLPFITKNDKKLKYYYINIPKSSNDRVRKLNVPIFHDADNGRKKIPCKYPGIRLDCNFESAIERFSIHVHNSAASAFIGQVSLIRQVLIYKHIVWGFLQAWTRRVRDHYNGCFKIQEIAQNLSLCQGDPSLSSNSLSEEQDLIYYIDYSNFYLKFDPVTLKETAMAFTIDNFETNYVCDVSLVQYYRQFFLINNMHYSDALKNIILFSEENGASKVTDFVYMQPKDNVDNTNPGFSTPGGISRTTVQLQSGQGNTKPVKPNMPSNPHSTNPITQQFNPQNNVPSVAAGGIKQNTNVALNNVQTNNNEQAPPGRDSSLLKPLIKTRTVEEINSSIELNKNSEESSVRLNSTLPDPGHKNRTEQAYLTLPAYIRQIVNDCYVRNAAEVAGRDVSVNPPEIQRIFTNALTQAMKMATVESFIDKMYVTLQKSFTNFTSRNIMNRTIYRALERKFPHLKSLLRPDQNRNVPPPSTGKASPQKIKKVYYSLKGENVEASDLNQRVKISSVKETEKVPAATKKPAAKTGVKTTLPTSPTQRAPSVEVNYHREHSYMKNSLNQPEQASTDQRPTSVGPSKFNTERYSSPTVAETSTPEESSCRINQKEQEKSEQRKSCKENVRGTQQEEKSMKGSGNVTRSSATVVETDDSISINLTLPLSHGLENSVGHRATLETVRVSEPSPEPEPSNLISEEESNELIESSSESPMQVLQTGEDGLSERESSGYENKEKDLFERFGLKPCSVLLNANDVVLYQKKRIGLRKRQRKVIYNVSDDSNDVLEDDDVDDDFVLRERSSKKKAKKVSDLQYMEARTRVLQRLRKRSQMYLLNDKEQKVYTSDELDQFFVCDKFDEEESDEEEEKGGREKEKRKKKEAEMKKKAKIAKVQKGDEEDKYKTLYNECLTRKAKVILVRLEDTDMSEKQAERWKIKTKSEGRLILIRDHSIEYENIPKNKRRYFELREGKLYLKDQYRVKNGKIVLVVNPEAGQNRISLKNETSFGQEESYFRPNFIKEERFFE